MNIKSLGVFCGSAKGNNHAYQEAATELGLLMARDNIALVYGGGKNGMMGTIADATLGAGGQALGVMPVLFEEYEVTHSRLTRLEMVPNMHVRKQRIEELSDAFAILPGGAGTMDEFFEQWTWMHIGVHNKPCAILNTNGYYSKLISFIEESMVKDGFLLPGYAQALIVADTPAEMLARLRAYVPLPGKAEMAKKVAAGRRD